MIAFVPRTCQLVRPGKDGKDPYGDFLGTIPDISGHYLAGGLVPGDDAMQVLRSEFPAPQAVRPEIAGDASDIVFDAWGRRGAPGASAVRALADLPPGAAPTDDPAA